MEEAKEKESTIANPESCITMSCAVGGESACCEGAWEGGCVE